MEFQVNRRVAALIVVLATFALIRVFGGGTSGLFDPNSDLNSKQYSISFNCQFREEEGNVVLPSSIIMIGKDDSWIANEEPSANGTVRIPVVQSEFQTFLAVFDNYLPQLVGVDLSKVRDNAITVPVVGSGTVEFQITSIEDRPQRIHAELFLDPPFEVVRGTGIPMLDFGSNVTWQVPTGAILAGKVPSGNPDVSFVKSVSEIIRPFIFEQFQMREDFKGAFVYGPFFGFQWRNGIAGSSVSWELLPSLGSYSWWNSGSFEADLAPNEMSNGERSMLNWGGHFEVKAGETRVIDLHEKKPGSIRGKMPIDGTNFYSPGLVQLWRDRGTGDLASSYLVGTQSPSSHDPIFHFGSLPPGKYKLLAQWRDFKEVMIFQEEIKLSSAQNLVLGEMLVENSSALKIITGFLDSNGDYLPEGEVEEWKNYHLGIPISIHALTDGGRDLVLASKFSMEPGGSITVRGLPAGSWEVRLPGAMEIVAEERGIADLVGESSIRVKLPTSKPVQFHFRVVDGG